ncbi:Rer1 family protein [Saccharomyces cerevisiae]|nr:Rer1 family protein [Saccharomyces cerevisiae]
MDYDSSDTMNGGSSNPLITKMNTMKLLYQHYLDKVTPHAKERWAVLGGLLCLFMVRITMAEGCKDEENNELEAGEKSEEFRPFIRRLPEFKFWYNSIRATVISLLLSLFSIFDIPVFWPILLMYFILLFFLTMRRQIQHMIKYRYIPLDIGKKKYSHSSN